MAHVTSQSKIQKIFQESPILAYRGNKELKKQIIGNNNIEDNKKKRVKKNYIVNVIRSYRIQEQCCQQVIETKSFKSTQTKPEFIMFQSIIRKSKWIIHLMEYNLCKIQYVRKSKGSFNFRLNCRRKDDEHTNL